MKSKFDFAIASITRRIDWQCNTKFYRSLDSALRSPGSGDWNEIPEIDDKEMLLAVKNGDNDAWILIPSRTAIGDCSPGVACELHSFLSNALFAPAPNEFFLNATNWALLDLDREMVFDCTAEIGLLQQLAHWCLGLPRKSRTDYQFCNLLRRSILADLRRTP